MSLDRTVLLRDSQNNPIFPESRGYESVDNNATAQGHRTATNILSSSSNNSNPKTLPQYVAALSATLSALAAGAALGWTSPIMTEIQKGTYHHIPVDANQMGWIGSFITLGAMIMCFPTGFICDGIGRKKTLLLLIVPFTVGWTLILCAHSIIMLYVGRLIIGMAVGACCVAAPLYCSEIAQKEIRGTLGSYFQLMISIGIFLAYLTGKYLNAFNYTIFCACLPLVFCVVFYWQPETPYYCLKRNLYDQALESLIKLRGDSYNVDAELNEIEGKMKESVQSSTSISQTLKQKFVRKAIIVSFALMLFQQFSGVNVIILYTSDIFKASKVPLDDRTAVIIVGGFQAFATFISSLVIDRLGRRILLLTSSIIVALSTVLLAIFFTLKYRFIAAIGAHTIDELGFLPVLALCLFVIVFSIGLGPIPWMITAEIFPADIKSVAVSAAGTFNWFLAFVITKFYLQLSVMIGEDSTFYIFSVISLMGAVFIYFIVPETKGKTIEQIQSDL